MRALLLAGVFAIACSKTKEMPAPKAEAHPSAVAVASSAPPRPVSVDCGDLECRAYDDFATAFESTLVDKPIVVAIGEAHAKKGFEWVETAAKRVTREVLPKLEGRASDLLLELMAPAQGCEQAKKATSQELGKIGKDQAPTAPNEYVTLGKAAEKVGIKVSQLHPSCKDFAEIAKSKSPPLTVLQTITALLTHDATVALGVPGRSDDKLFVIYGGAFHTEPTPPEERAEFSVAAKVSKAAKNRYVSVHVFVREYIDDKWDLWPWYPHFKPDQHADRVVVFHPKPQHYVLITAAAKRP